MTSSAAISRVPARHRFHSLQVAQVIRETPDAVTLVLDIPLHLAGTFAYRAGQFVSVRVEVEGEQLVRSYSMSSAPQVDDEFRITVKQIPDGVVSRWLLENVHTGAALDVSPPAGTFVLGNRGADLALFAAGSGITPVISLLKAALATAGRRVQLLYANRDLGSTIFAAELDRLVHAHPGRLTVQHQFDLDSGFVTSDDVRNVAAGLDDAEVYVCGPAEFMTVVESGLLTAGVAPGRIHVERFTPHSSTDLAEGPVDDVQITIRLGGKKVTVAHHQGATLLQTARSAGLKAPSSCEAGNCATCMARLLEGAVEMRENEALTTEEVEEGWVLTCQALPVTPVIDVVYE